MAGFALSFVTRHSCFFAVSEKYAGTCSVNVLCLFEMKLRALGMGKGPSKRGRAAIKCLFMGVD